MKAWSKYPVLFEINTWVWLGELSRKHGRVVDLGTVPPEEWDAIASLGFDAVWFMGVWERSPAGIAVSMRNKGLLEDFRRALPDFAAEDNVGSPYCVRRYVVDEHLGGRKALAAARKNLAQRGIRLLLDFVPNHVAPDHPWVGDHPEYLVQGSVDDARSDPAAFIEAGGKVFACGRDPYFPAWPDVLQLDAFQPGLREAAIETISELSEQCDGIRCDMAMLMLNNIFERTWGARAGAKPANDYWRTVISAIKGRYREFRFIAEAYWDLEWELQQQGFDYCYDKRLYDRLREGRARPVREHLLAGLEYQNKLARFLENHDEPRAAASFSREVHEAAALITYLSPGLRFFHQGQFEGRLKRIPPHLARAPVEPVDEGLKRFYDRLLPVLRQPQVRQGQWRLLECEPAWDGNWTADSFLAFTWQVCDGNPLLVTINFAPHQSQCYVRLPFTNMTGRTVQLKDSMGPAQYERNGDDMASRGLYLDLPPWGYHVFTLSSSGQRQPEPGEKLK